MISGDPLDRVVAGGMAVGVVDLLEMIDVDHQRRHAALVAPAEFEGIVGYGEKGAPVHQAGQIVGVGQLSAA